MKSIVAFLNYNFEQISSKLNFYFDTSFSKRILHPIILYSLDKDRSFGAEADLGFQPPTERARGPVLRRKEERRLAQHLGLSSGQLPLSAPAVDGARVGGELGAGERGRR